MSRTSLGKCPPATTPGVREARSPGTPVELQLAPECLPLPRVDLFARRTDTAPVALRFRTLRALD